MQVADAPPYLDLRYEERQYIPSRIPTVEAWSRTLTHCRCTSPSPSSPVEKPLCEGAEGGRHDPEAAGVGGQVAGDAGEGEGEGPAREGEARGGEAQEGGGGAVQARADAEGAVRGRPEDGAVRVLQGGDVREGGQVQVQPRQGHRAQGREAEPVRGQQRGEDGRCVFCAVCGGSEGRGD